MDEEKSKAINRSTGNELDPIAREGVVRMNYVPAFPGNVWGMK